MVVGYIELEPVACAVLVDKQGLDQVAEVPVESLVQVIRVDSDGGA